MRNMLLMLGVVLWIGALSPEIFTDSTSGCIFDGEGNELSREEAQKFMESYFYKNKADSGESPEIEFKFGIAKLFGRN